MPYAVRTKVPSGQTKNEIERLIERAGADAFGIMQMNGRVQVAFRLAGRNILVRLTKPKDMDPQQERSMWRALLLSIKAKLENVERGIETIEEAFLAQTVLRSGETVYEATQRSLPQHYDGGDVPLLPKP